MCETSIIVGLETISIHLVDFDVRKWQSTAMLHVFFFSSVLSCLTDVLFLYSTVMFHSDKNISVTVFNS